MAHTATARELTVEELSKKSYLRPRQRQDLEQTISGLEDALRSPQDLGQADPAMLRRQLKNSKTMLKNNSPPEYDSASKAKIHKLEQVLREDIEFSNMPTYTQMERGRPTDVDHHTAWEAAMKKKVLAWKNCLLILDPHNTQPNFLSIARLRGDTVRGDPKAFASGYDQIRWDDEIEEDLIRDMDSQAYYSFLELKLLGWAKATICKELDWTPKMYEAALERLRQSSAAKETLRREDEVEVEDGANDDDGHQPPPTAELRNSGLLMQELDQAGITKSEFARMLGLAVSTVHTRFTRGWKTEDYQSAMKIINARTEPLVADTEEPVSV